MTSSRHRRGCVASDRVVAGSVCFGVEGEVVETASDPFRSATGEQPVVCEGSEGLPA